ncbi:YaaL family protein [Clostridiaceae bacterium Marseille-Q4145]|nr:YaaL family protein [Clostridiaceae bacterium Marseille-Q4145]
MKGEAPVPDTRRQQLMEDLARTKSALDRAYSNFENVVDPDLVDSSIYELQAVQLRYRFLLRQASLLEESS